MFTTLTQYSASSQKKIILAFRLQTLLVIIALLAFDESSLLLKSGTFKIVALYLVANLLLIALPSRFFRSSSVVGTMLVADVVFVSACIYFSGNASGDLYLLYFLAIFMAALSRDLRATVIAAVVVSAVYLWVSSNSTGGPQIFSSGFLLRIPLFFVTAFFAGFLANQARQREIEERRSKQVAMELTQELERTKRQEEKTLSEYQDFVHIHDNVMSSIHSGICAVDVRGVVTMFNREAERVTGLPAAEVTGRPASEFSLLAPLAAFLTQAYTMGRLCSSREAVLITEGSRAIEIGFSVSPLRNRRGTIVGAIATFRDLAEVKQLRDQVKRSEQMAFLGKMMSSLAQEILDPLKSINTFAGLQCERTNSTDRFHQFAEVIVKETSRINGIVSQTLSFVNDETTAESVDLNDVIQSAVSSSQKELGDRSVSVTLDLDPLLPLTMGDHLKLRRVCSQLILNAAQSVKKGGGLRISTHADGSNILARFADNGPGVPHELREKIFDPFFTTKPEATGLGLAVAQKLLNDCGGTILLVESADQGAVFEIRLPSQAVLEQPTEVSSAA
jgi:PAS domain S-box-containing protein